MQNRSPFGNVDLIAAEHRIAPFWNASLSDELDEQSNGLLGNAIFGEIQIQARAFRTEARASAGILRK
jgi:hypothetical protein